MNEEQLQSIVAKVLAEVGGQVATAKAPSAPQSTKSIAIPAINLGNGVFADMNEAIAAAKVAQKKLKNMPLEFREKIIAKIREKTVANSELLANMAVEETGMGKVGHKILKHQLVASKTPGTECIKPEAFTGDQGLTLVERGPWGVVGAITPSTNPSETVICNAIGMIAAGNTVVFNPHPNAANTANFAVQMINQAAKEVGAYENLATSVLAPTLESGNIMFAHKDIELLVATGGPGVVKAVLSSGKRAIAAGAGNPPVLVDETADIKKAAADIINGATFDNNLPCIAEKEVIALHLIADQLIDEMVHYNDAYYLTLEQADRLAKEVLVEKNGHFTVNRNYVGRDAHKILASIGIQKGENIRCIIFEGPKDHILIKEELMMPILGIVRVQDIEEGIAVAVELEGGNRHSAHMHSLNIDNLTKFARAIDTAIFVKNGPSYAGIGFGGEGFSTFTIASKTGEGLTNAASFTKARRCVMSEFLNIR